MFEYIHTKIKNQIIRLQDWRDLYLFKKYKKRALIDFDVNWFKDKRVVIIGGADSAYKEKLGEYIDSFDVVVRVNNGVRVIEKYVEYIGKRTDFLFHTLYEDVDGGGSPIELELWQRMGVQNLVFSHHTNSIYGENLKRFVLSKQGDVKIVQMSEDVYQHNMRSIYPYHPTTGLIAIETILMCKPSMLYITGITFFRTAHQQEYRKGSLDQWLNIIQSKDSLHNPEAEYAVFKQLYFANKSVFVLDKTLDEIIKMDVD